VIPATARLFDSHDDLAFNPEIPMGEDQDKNASNPDSVAFDRRRFVKVGATLGQDAQDVRRTPVTRHELRPAARRLRVLLAEDNPVNQTVGLRTLEKMGHAVVVANNGREALSLLSKSEEVDLMLTDVQMPEMDGLTATRHIRAAEKNTGRHIPIIAMTARAMQGDKETCLAAGMDGYIAKPIDREELEETIAHNALGPDQTYLDSKPDTLTISNPSRAVAWDLSKALERLGGDEQLLHDVAKIFLEETPKLMDRLHQAVAAGDPTTVERAAHSLKGQLGYFDPRAADAARELEEMGREDRLEHAAERLASFQSEVAGLMKEVQRVVRGQAAHGG
jgi:two-component system sensor histidine kinase/response regulator